MNSITRTVLLTCLALGILSLAAPAGENLVRNGSFDEGTEYALHWERANGLTVFQVEEEGRGRVVKMNTQVEKTQAREFAMAFAKDPTLKAPAPKILKKKSYATIGGGDGVALDSEYIEAKPGQNYMLSADVKGDGSPFVWIKGFLHLKGRWRDAYQTRLNPFGVKKDKWQRFRIGFNPSARNKAVNKFKVRLYSYWPNGIYYFDNIRVEEISEAEMAAFLEARETTGAIRVEIE